MARLTAAKVQGLTKPGRYGDGGWLYLSIAKAGSKSWVMRLRVDGKRTDKGLGGYPTVSLTAARKVADAYRVAVEEGRNPWSDDERDRMERAQDLDRIPTFKEAACKVHAAKLPGFSSAKHGDNWIKMLERHVFHLFGDTPVDEIRPREVKDFFERLGPTLTETARRLRFRMREIFDDCIESEYITVNPAGDGIRASVKRWSSHHKVQHFKALPYQQVPGVIDKILSSQGMRETRLALAFQVLTAARSGEVRGARWDEIDLDARTWSIPAERMKSDKKSDKNHVVPLSIEAHLLLQDAKEAIKKREKSEKRRPDYDSSFESDPMPDAGLIFPHPSGKPLSDAALPLRARKDELGCTPHGFRSSFKDWATASGRWSWEAIELCLAHHVGNSVAQAYFRDDLLEQRRPIMEAWSQYVWPVRPF